MVELGRAECEPSSCPSSTACSPVGRGTVGFWWATYLLSPEERDTEGLQLAYTCRGRWDPQKPVSTEQVSSMQLALSSGLQRPPEDAVSVLHCLALHQEATDPSEASVVLGLGTAGGSCSTANRELELKPCTLKQMLHQKHTSPI